MTSNVEKPLIDITEMLAHASSTLRREQINQFAKRLKGPSVRQSRDSRCPVRHPARRNVR
jgi:hypothetical protein